MVIPTCRTENRIAGSRGPVGHGWTLPDTKALSKSFVSHALPRLRWPSREPGTALALKPLAWFPDGTPSSLLTGRAVPSTASHFPYARRPPSSPRSSPCRSAGRSRRVEALKRRSIDFNCRTCASRSRPPAIARPPRSSWRTSLRCGLPSRTCRGGPGSTPGCGGRSIACRRRCASRPLA